MTLLTLVIISLAISSVYSRHGERIIGGKDANITNHPYHIQIVKIPSSPTPQAKLYPICSGAIIGDNVVLTHNSCIKDENGKKNPNNFFIRAGTSYRSGEGASWHRVIQIITERFFGDGCLIFVEPAFTFNGMRRSIPLSLAPVEDGYHATISGWGYTDAKKNAFAEKLQSRDVDLHSELTCKGMADWSQGLNYVCGTGGSVCSGDSGAPVVINGALVGVVGYRSSEICGYDGQPVMILSTYYLNGWIKTTLPHGFGVIFVDKTV